MSVPVIAVEEDETLEGGMLRVDHRRRVPKEKSTCSSHQLSSHAQSTIQQHLPIEEKKARKML